MNKLLFIILFSFSFNLFAQIPETEDSIYWSGNYCDTAETIEEALNQWIWSSDVNDCVQPNLKDIENLWIALWLSDTYECCCEIASLPGSDAVWNGFMESDCPAYLDSIGFVYDDPEYINWTSLDELDLELNGIYIDIYGRYHIVPPKGVSIMNKKTYIRFN